jgi:hypothetical protein
VQFGKLSVGASPCESGSQVTANMEGQPGEFSALFRKQMVPETVWGSCPRLSANTGEYESVVAPRPTIPGEYTANRVEVVSYVLGGRLATVEPDQGGRLLP